MVEGVSLCFVLQLLMPAAAASNADRVMVIAGSNALNVLVHGTTLLVSKKTHNRPAAALLLVCGTHTRTTTTQPWTLTTPFTRNKRLQELHSLRW